MLVEHPVVILLVNIIQLEVPDLPVLQLALAEQEPQEHQVQAQ